jgi:hypothetical protein
MDKVAIGLVHRLIGGMGNGEDAAKHRISVGSVFIIECTKNVVADGGDDFA